MCMFEQLQIQKGNLTCKFFRLTGDRGIPILPKVFEKVKFKGKGHEVSWNKVYTGGNYKVIISKEIEML